MVYPERMAAGASAIFNVVIGTAGHIDHGKSSLIQRLTGVDPDRLPEEKARGLTIDLGFAPLTLDSGEQVGIIDVPGHERLVKNMVAGATGIDVVLLVVAADDGVMPQTREHLAIMQLLDLRHGLIAMTKRDLVDDDFRELVRADIEDCVENTFLAGAPIIEVSSVTGEGVDEVRRALQELLAEVQPRETGGVFRMPIQRVFSAKGFGTVVTGVPVAGQAKIGDSLEIVPLGQKGRVRGLQAYGQSTELVQAGHSSAINITDVEYRQVHRGMMLTKPGYFRSANMFEARFQYHAANQRPLRHQAPVRVHVGTAEVLGRVYLLEQKTLEPGETSFVQFRLDTPLVAAAGDRFVVRSYSPATTLGGGEILDRSRWRLKTGKSYVVKELQEKAEAIKDARSFLAATIHSAGYEAVGDQDLAVRAGIPLSEVRKLLAELKESGEIEITDRGEQIVSRARLDEARTQALEFAAAYFGEHRRSRFVEQARLRQSLDCQDGFFHHLLTRLAKEELVTPAGEGRLRFRDYGPTLTTEDEEIKGQLLADLSAGNFQPPSPAELATRHGWARDITEELARLLADDGDAIQLGDGIYLHSAELTDAQGRIRSYIGEHGSVTASQAKTLLGSSRKYIIPLLEHLDRIGFTIRRGDVRELRRT